MEVEGVGRRERGGGGGGWQEVEVEVELEGARWRWREPALREKGAAWALRETRERGER